MKNENIYKKVKSHDGLWVGKYIGVLRGKFKDGINVSISIDYDKSIFLEIDKKECIFHVGQDDRGKMVLYQM